MDTNTKQVNKIILDKQYKIEEEYRESLEETVAREIRNVHSEEVTYDQRPEWQKSFKREEI